MKYIKAPVRVAKDLGEFRDLEYDETCSRFEAVIILDAQDTQICLVPADLNDAAEELATEIAEAINIASDFLDAARMERALLAAIARDAG